MKSVALPTIATALLAAMSCQLNAAVLNTMNDVGAALQACWTPPANSENTSVTLSFSFRRDGTLIGRPRPTAIKVGGDAKARQGYVEAATSALQHCLPLSFSPALAKGIAGKVYTLQFNSPRK